MACLELARNGRLCAGAEIYKRKIESLSTEVRDLDKGLGQTISQRDQIESDATELAEAVGRYFNEDVGEHSSANCPIRNAMTLLDGVGPEWREALDSAITDSGRECQHPGFKFHETTLDMLCTECHAPKSDCADGRKIIGSLPEDEAIAAATMHDDGSLKP